MKPDSRKRLIAVFRPQVWVGDEAVDVPKSSVEFDATSRFLQLPLEAIRKFKENDYDSDDLAEELPARHQHDGPFEVDVDIDDWLEQNGIDGGRAKLTAEQLDSLRQTFK